MRYAALLLAALTALAGTLPARASEMLGTRGPSLLDDYVGSARHFVTSEAPRTVKSSVIATDAVDDMGSGEPVVTSTRAKSPAKAFFLSLLLPGLGEAYAGNYTRAGIFMGIEAASWTAWSVYHGRGDDKRADFIAFQAEHWSFERYDAYRNAVWTRANAVASSISSADSISVLVGTHHYDDCCGQEMPKVDDQYEEIGKYYRFSYGWDDATNPLSGVLLSEEFPQPAAGEEWGTDVSDWLSGFSILVTPATSSTTGLLEVQYLKNVTSENRDIYVRMRESSNNDYNTAKKFTTVIVFNHIISAIHAARLTSRMNRTGVYEAPKTSVRMMMYPGTGEAIPMLTMQRRF